MIPLPLRIFSHPLLLPLQQAGERAFAALQPVVLQRAAHFANHLLLAEPEAMRRLAPFAGRSLKLRAAFSERLQWSGLFCVTAPGLLTLVTEAGAPPELSIELSPPREPLGHGLQGKWQRKIEGDAEFAAVMDWLAKNLRWEFEEDLAPFIGNAAAHFIGQGARRVTEKLRAHFAPTNAAAANAAAAPHHAG